MQHDFVMCQRMETWCFRGRANISKFLQGSPRIECQGERGSRLLCPAWVWKGSLFSAWAGGLVKGGKRGESSCRQFRESWSPRKTERGRHTSPLHMIVRHVAVVISVILAIICYWLWYGPSKSSKARNAMIRQEVKRPFPLQTFWLVTVTKAKVSLIIIMMALFCSRVPSQCESEPASTIHRPLKRSS